MSLVAKIHSNNPISRWFSEKYNSAVERIIYNANEHLKTYPISSTISQHRGLIKGAAVYALLKHLAYLNNDVNWLNKTYVQEYLQHNFDFYKSTRKQTITIQDEAIDCLTNAAFHLSWVNYIEHDFIKPILRSIKCREETNITDKWKKEWNTTINEAKEIVGNIARCWQAVNSSKNHPIISNPAFELSGQIGGAQADIIVNDTLISIVVNERLTKENFHEAIAYLLLDSNNKYKLQKVAWLFPLRQTSVVININNLFHDIKATRSQFKQMIELNYPNSEFDDDIDLFKLNDRFC